MRWLKHLEQSCCERPKKPPGGSGDPAAIPEQPEVETEVERDVGPPRRLLCAACSQFVTTAADAIEVANQHAHTFVNPGGFVYKIRCFSHAAGCAGEGPTSDFWTWFPGYRWQLGSCGGCGSQLGWIFHGADHVFFGLIISRLAESDD